MYVFLVNIARQEPFYVYSYTM